MTNQYLALSVVLKAQDPLALRLTLTDKPKGIKKSLKVINEKITQIVEQKKNEILHWYGEKEIFTAVVGNKNTEKLRLLGADIFKELEKQNAAVVNLETIATFTAKEKRALLSGMFLASYRFNKYKKGNDYKLTLITSELFISKKELNELFNIHRGICLTKTLVNESPNVMNAIAFSQEVEKAATTFGFEAQILHKQEIEALQMGGLLAVNKGSATPPTFNILSYKPQNAQNTQPLVLVGKGVTFDTGGYSIKTGGYMSTMKSDMAGGAAVLGVMAAVAANKLPYYVIGLVPCTDNMISSEALIVDEVITMMDSTSVEVQNTDAEGRLILADALTYAKRFNPELVIDIATLTGASAVITGSFGSSVCSNTPKELSLLKTCGEITYERLLELPLWEEYGELLQSDIADLKNIGGAVGGAITAAKFLEHFTAYPWIHLDIAGSAFVKENKGYKQAGATATPVQLLYEYILTKTKK